MPETSSPAATSAIAVTTSAATTDAATRPAARKPDPKIVCRRVGVCVMRDFGLDIGCLLAPSRGSPHASLARQVAMYLCHVAFAMSFAAIGRAFGRDRTTVAHACRVIEDRRDDIWFDCRIATLERVCGARTEECAR